MSQDHFVDNIIEDEAERESLLAKPTCFIVVGKPGVGKSTLAKKIAESWKCILIDDTDLLYTHIRNKTKQGIELLNILSEGRSIPEEMVLQLILAKLNSPEVEHYGYVLCCLPFMSDECMKINEQIELIRNLKLTPDFIINIKCADKDLVYRLSGLKQHPHTGTLHTRDQWQREEEKEEGEEEEKEEKEEEAEEGELEKHIIDQMVWIPENLPRNALSKINLYKDTMLRPLEDYIADHNPIYLLELDGNKMTEELHSYVMFTLKSMARKRISIPVLLHQADEGEPTEDIETEELLRFMSASRSVAPGFRWRRSRWGRTCPVALKEGKIIPGIPEFCVGFQDKIYILSSQEAYQKFLINPRRYLLPPMPRIPCRVSIIGPPQAGKSTLCKLLAQHYNSLVLDMDMLVESLHANYEQERLDKVKEESTQAAIEKIKMKMKKENEEITVTEAHPDVQALVLRALEKAKRKRTSPNELYAMALEMRLKEIEEAQPDGDATPGWVLDNCPANLIQIDDLDQAGILPDIIFCLIDRDGKDVLKRLYEMNKDSVDEAVRKRLQDELSEKEKLVLSQEGQESDVEVKSAELETNQEAASEESEAEDVEPSDQCELGYPDGPEMNVYKMQLQEFAVEWERMQADLPVSHYVLEIGGKSPDDLLQEMIFEMEKPFKYVSWELSEMDMEEEAEDMRALTMLEEASESYENNTGEQNEADMTAKRLLGDTRHFCPVVLKENNVLQPCTEEIAAKYREKTFFFSSVEARDTFIENPEEFVAQTGPLKLPAMRFFFFGARGSGKTTHGEWLAKQLGIFHIQFREQLQMLIIAKTKKKVRRSDELDYSGEAPETLEILIKEAKGENGEIEDTSTETKELSLRDDDKIIESFLSDGEPLTPEILDMLIRPYWEQEPYKSTGFILEGFPQNSDDVEYMVQQHLFPDLMVIMTLEAPDVQRNLMPIYLREWHERRTWREKQLAILDDLHKKKREDNIAKRRAELRAELGPKPRLDLDEPDGEGDEKVSDVEDEIERKLKEEFPVEEQRQTPKNEETEEEASERLEMEIEGRFLTDENSLTPVMEQLSELKIPKMPIDTSRKIRTVQRQLLNRIQPLVTNRESLLQKCQPISYSLAQKLLFSSYKLHSAFGCWDPIKHYNERDMIQPLHWPLNNSYPLLYHHFIYFFTSKENRNIFMLNPLKYLRQPKPYPSLPVKIAVVGPPKSGKTTVAEMLANKYGLARLSMGNVIRMVLKNDENTDLAVQLQMHLSQGLAVPDELAIQCLEVVLMGLCCSQGYVLDGFPKTLKQSELMGSRSIIPMIAVELELDAVDVLQRGLEDKMKPNKPHLMHDSAEILHIRNSCYKQEVELVRQYFRQQYQNWIVLDGTKSTWWILNSILKEVSVSIKYIQSYLERMGNRQAAGIHRLCITPKELQCRLGEFGEYCPVCLVLHCHLVDCSETLALTHAAEYRRCYYKMCGNDHLQWFLDAPDEFVTPGGPRNLPQPHMLPRKLSQGQLKSRFPQQAEMKGLCPVTYLDGKQRFEDLVRGKMEFAVEYRKKIYVFETKQKQDKFLRTPEIYCDQKLPSKVPPVCEPVPLTSLPTLGYLEQGVAVAIIKAMTAVGCLKPKYPFLDMQRSACIYVAFYLKAFNHQSTNYTRQMYKKKLALFEENSELIPYLMSTMRGNYRPPSERPIDYEFKLNKFLALGDLPGTSNVL